ncbi:MAG: choice-of-anchor J domain-containing protein [Bacteroidales bacterium]|nr:choice-of-anchor J domain-containing protein [Bacteroidales bacterium]MDD4673418.1 choice-of-anchor J domain-containing protein [Bacteroidales bacterium]
MKNLYNLLFGFVLVLLSLTVSGQTIDQSFDSDKIPYGWENDDTNDADWVFTDKNSYGPPADHSGTGYFAFVDSRYIPQNKVLKLITPRLDLTSGSTTLSYYLYLKKGTYGGNVNTPLLFVEISEDGADWIALKEHKKSENNNEWFNYTIDLAAYNTSDNVRIRFRAISSGYDWDSGYCSIGLDDVTGPNLFVPEHDVAIMSIAPDYIYRKDVEGKYLVTLKNWGSTEETFNLSYALEVNTDIQGTIPVSNLAAGETREVEVPVNFNTVLTDNIVFTADLATDEYLTGNTSTLELKVHPTTMLVSESFDTFKGDVSPYGWTQAKGLPTEALTYGSSGWRETSYYVNTPPQAIYFGFSKNNSSVLADWVISHPVNTIGEGDLRVSFSLMANGVALADGDSLSVMYTTDDGASWSCIGSVKGDNFSPNVWSKYYFSLQAVEAENLKVALYALDNIDGLTTSLYIDDFTLEVAPDYDYAMLPVSKAAGAMSDTVIFAGTELSVRGIVTNYGQNAESVPVKWILVEDGQTGSQSVTVGSFGEETPVTFTQTLTAPLDEGYYTLKIFTDYANDFDSSNDTVTVKLGVYSPYTDFVETFDESKEMPLGWSALVPFGISPLSIQTSYTKSAPNSVKINTSNTPYNTMLVSPAVNFAPGESFRLRFWMNGNASASVEVGLLANPSDSTTFTSLESFSLTKSWTYEENEIAITHDQLSYIAFKYTSRGSTVYLDDISLEVIPPYAVEILAFTEDKSIAEGGSVTFAATVSNMGSLSETFNLAVTSDLVTSISDKDGNSITSILLDIGETDTVYVAATAPASVSTPEEKSVSLAVTSQQDVEATAQVEFSLYAYEPFAELEQGFESGTSFPLGWVPVQTKDKLLRIYSSSYNANSGDNYLHFANADETETAMLVMPAVQQYALYRVSLYAKGNPSFEIGTVSDPYQPETFVSFSDVLTTSYSYAYYEFDLPATDGQKYIAIKMINDGGYSSLQIDDISVVPVGEFEMVSEVLDLNKTSHAGGFAWYKVGISNTGYGNDTYNLTASSDWSTSIFDLVDGTEISSISIDAGELNSVMLRVEIPAEGVIDGELVDASITVASQNGDVETTSTVSTIGYNPVAEIVENFDENSTMPQFWIVHDGSSSTARINTNASNSNSPNNNLSLFRSSYSEVDAQVALPALMDESKYQLSYWVKGSLGATILVGTLDDPNDTTSFTQLSSYEVFGVYTQQKFDFNVTDGPTCLVFKNASKGSTIYVDDVEVYSYTSMDIAPSHESDNVPAEQTITIGFSKAATLLDGEEITSSNVSTFVTLKDLTSDELLPFTASVNEAKTEVQLTADSPFISEHVIEVSASNLLDVNGLEVTGVSSQFTIIDLNAPVWLEGYPSLNLVTGSRAELSLKFDEAATYYYMLIGSGDDAPTAAEVLAGEAYGSVTPVQAGSGEFIENAVTVSLTGLTEVTSYKLYFAAIDEVGNEQTETVEISFTTLDATAPEWLEGYPSLGIVTGNSVEVSIMLDKAATYYYMLIGSGDDTPTVAEVFAGEAYGSVTPVQAGSGEFIENAVTVSLSGLAEITSYKLYFVAIDELGNEQTETVEISFTTLDATAPVWTEGYPVVESVGIDTISFIVSLNEVSQVSYLVVLSGSTAPSVQEVIDGENYADVTIAASGTVDYTESPVEEIVRNLTSNTAYQIYLVAVDVADNIQESSVVLEFTTDNETGVGMDETLTFSVYPNPFAEHINVSAEGVKNVRVFSLSGSIIKSVSASALSESINLGFLSSGSYIVVIEFIDGKTASRVIIKN